jgi:hypothetical protein
VNRDTIDLAMRAGRLLLIFGMVVIGVQAASNIAIEWCVAWKDCKFGLDPKIYRDFYGLVAVCTGAVVIVCVVLIDVLQQSRASRSPKPDRWA